MSILMRKDMCRGRVVLPDEKIVLAEKKNSCRKLLDKVISV